jgi:hypothetical protein
VPQHLPPSARGLGADYRRRRAALAPPRPGECCPRCHKPFQPGEPLDAGHEEDRALGGAPDKLRWEHASCNRRAGGKLAVMLQKVRKFSGEEVPPSRKW